MLDVLLISYEQIVSLFQITQTWPKPAYGRQGLDWIVGSPVRYAKFESIRYFIDIDIMQNCLIDIDIFQNHFMDIDIDIFKIPISISISIFFKSVDISTIYISYRYFNKEKE